MEGEGLVLDHLVDGQKIKNRFREVVAIASSPIGPAGSNADLHWTLDPAGALGFEFPAGSRAPRILFFAAVNTATI